MKIKSLYIKKYKILQDFLVNFDDTSNVNVIIGKNGSGKTTFFEAIIHIFRELSFASSKSTLQASYHAINLQFEIKYNRKGNDIAYKFLIDDEGDEEIEFKVNGEDFSLNRANLRPLIGQEFDFTSKPIFQYLPDHIVTYYSGESIRITSLFERHLNDASDALQKGQNIPLREFINIDTNSVRKVLISILPFAELKKKNAIGKTLSLDHIESVEIYFKQPWWLSTAQKKFKKLHNINSEDALVQFNPDFYYAEGEVGQFVDTLEKFSEKIIEPSTGIISSIKIHPGDMREYFATKKIEQIGSKKTVQIKTSLDFFKMLDHTTHSDLIQSIKMYIKLNDSGDISEFENLSEGEHQIKLVLGLSEIFKEKETLFLFDEPDTYLHPEWQIALMEKLIKIKDSQVFVSTHSTTALTSLQSNAILRMERGTISPIIDYKTYAADPNLIIEKIQRTESPIRSKLQPKIDEIIKLIDSNRLEDASASINDLEEDYNIDSVSTIISELRMHVKRKRIFGE